MSHTPLRRRSALAALLVLPLPALALGAVGVMDGIESLGAREPVHGRSEVLAAHPVARMVGDWEGRGWSSSPDGTRSSFQVRERVHWNLAGTAIIAEGYGWEDVPDTGERVVGHDAIGVIEIDPETKGVRMVGRRAGTPFTAHAVDVLDAEAGILRWHPPQPPQGEVRFTITLTADAWRELGEYSPDGEQWFPFMQMDLTRRRSTR